MFSMERSTALPPPWTTIDNGSVPEAAPSEVWASVRDGTMTAADKARIAAMMARAVSLRVSMHSAFS